MRGLALIEPTLRALRRRLIGLAAFAALFLLTAAATRILVGTHEGHLEFDRLFELGGYPLLSGLLLLGWVIGRFPLIATLVLVAGVFSNDRAAGYARIYGARPVSRIDLYGVRLAVLAGIAFLVSAALLPLFDVLLIGHWAGPATFVLVAAYVLVYGSLTAALSVWTRADAWIALGLALISILWHTLRAAGVLDAAPPGIREVITMALPPHGALIAIETAFANVQPIPWEACLYVVVYASLLLLTAGWGIVRREI
ncbi:MAG: hypothetical protein ACRELX_13635 [Longimicrobiales bacterium]